MNIIASNWTYSSASNNIENTADRKDIELSGIELFNKYIRYDLGSSSVSTSVMGNTNLSKGMIETILKPSKHILKFRQIKSNLSTLIHIFAVQMHKHKQFSKAIELYELYLAQESDIHSFDCIITRYYIELAKIGCATKEEAYACLRPIDLKAVKLDLYKLSNNGKLSNFNVVRDEMDTIELKQTDFINYTIAQRKRKKVGVITAISLTSAVVAIIGFFTLNATVIQPSIHYNKANELFQIGDYEGALSQLYETGYGWSDTRQQELMARAGMAFKSGDYMTGIQYVEEAGGTVNIDYDCKGGNLTNNPLRSGPLAAYIQTPTRPGYVFDSWSLIDFKLTNEKEAYEASVSLKADWVICQYEITYVLNGGTNSSANPNSYTVEDPNIQLAAPIKFGNDFLGWKYDSTYVTEIDTSWCKNIILKAEWKERALTEEEIIEKNAHPLLSADGKSLTYGLYPQTCVSNSALISRLETLSPSASGYYFDQNDATYYYPYVAKPYESSYKFDDGTTIAYGTKYWFRCEPISWKVLQTSSGTYSVVSEKLLDAHRYNEDYSGTKSRTDYQGDTATVYTNNYKYSEIRSWLNTDFLDMAFALGSSSIKTTVVDNSAKTTDSTSNSYACEYTDDEVYLLSYWDYRNASYGFSSDESRRCKTTDFARARGAFSSTSSSYPNNGHYWTRSPRSDDSKFAWYVSYGGYLDAVYVDYEGGGVRPAITLSI